MSAFDGSKGPGMSGAPDLDDILSSMFGMGGGMPGFGSGAAPRRPRRSPNEEQKYEVTLEDLYKGKTVKFASTKNVICSLCKGSGGKEKAKPKQCSTCGGQGMAFLQSSRFMRLMSVFPRLQTSYQTGWPRSCDARDCHVWSLQRRWHRFQPKGQV